MTVTTEGNGTTLREIIHNLCHFEADGRKIPSPDRRKQEILRSCQGFKMIKKLQKSLKVVPLTTEGTDMKGNKQWQGRQDSPKIGPVVKVFNDLGYMSISF